MSLTKYERETIINFNQEEKTASIFTYERTWQRHLENKLGLKPVFDNGKGGREYELDKSRIKPPRAKKKMTKRTKVLLSNAREAKKSSATAEKSRGRKKK